jgi:type I restriction enzyme, S subunit
VRLVDVLAEPLINGRSVPTADVGFPVLRLTALDDGRVDLRECKTGAWSAAEASRYLVQAGDFLVARGNGSRALVGRGGVVPAAPAAVAFPDTLIRVRVNRDLLDARYLRYVWNSAIVRRQIEAAARTTAGIYKVNQQDLEAISFPLPPVPEQRRIVAALEEHLSDLDAAVAGLERARANVERFRESVRAAAVTGTLFTLQPHDEVEPKDEDEQPLPAAWRFASIVECTAREVNSITDGPFGSNLKTEHYVDAGPRVIRLQNIGRGEFINSHAHISRAHFATLRKHEVFAGDIVIAALGETLPRACIIPEHVGPAIVKADCIRFKPDTEILLPEFANIALNAEPTRKRVTAMVHGVGRPRLNLSEIKAISFPLPPVGEQRAIVAEVERRLAVADRTAAEIDVQLARAARLRQSILKRAFEGKLVPQDPSDEPASVLLDRICAERASATSARSGRSPHVRV